MTSISRKVSKRLVQRIEKWKLHRATGAELAVLANQKATVIRGWINYYGQFHLYCMRRVFRTLNARLVRFVMNKYKRYRRRRAQARQFLIGGVKSTDDYGFPNCDRKVPMKIGNRSKDLDR